MRFTLHVAARPLPALGVARSRGGVRAFRRTARGCARRVGFRRGRPGRRPARPGPTPQRSPRPRPASPRSASALRRALLSDLPFCAVGARGPPPRCTASRPSAIVLLEAADTAAADRGARALADAGVVDWVEPLFTREAMFASYAIAPGTGATTLDSLPNDPLLRANRQWGLWNVGGACGGFYGGIARADAHAPEAWRISVGADDVKLAIADTGIDPDAARAGRTSGGRRDADRGRGQRDRRGRARGDRFVRARHAGRGRDGRAHQRRTALLAPRASRACAEATASPRPAAGSCRSRSPPVTPERRRRSTSPRAMLHATDVGARAMNLSFAGTGGSRLERLALTYAITRGCVVVAAAGNGGARADARPAPCTRRRTPPTACASRWARATSSTRAPRWSSYGPGLDLVAPGRGHLDDVHDLPELLAARSTTATSRPSGTSFAAPFVTGAVGLLAAARPELTDTDFQHVIRESADDIGDPGVDARTGWGRLEPRRARSTRCGPGIGIWHDEVAAQIRGARHRRRAPLAVGEAGPGTLDRFHGLVTARRWLALATVTLPDSFADSVRVWVRASAARSPRAVTTSCRTSRRPRR